MGKKEGESCEYLQGNKQDKYRQLLLLGKPEFGYKLRYKCFVKSFLYNGSGSDEKVVGQKGIYPPANKGGRTEEGTTPPRPMVCPHSGAKSSLLP